MSLTSFLNIKDVRERFHELFPIPRLINTKKEILALPLTTNYGLIGTAFDYLLRFYIKVLNPNAITRRWVAEGGLKLLKKCRKDDNIIINDKSKLVRLKSINKLSDKTIEMFREEKKVSYNLVKKGISLSKEIYSLFLKDGKINDTLIKIALLLGKLDPIYRARYVPRKIKLDNKDIKDLNNLITLVDPRLFKAKKICLLNPTFKKASELVKGADADLVIDDMLIDIKTTKYLQNKQDYFNQLIGYYTLYRIGGISGMPATNKIKRLGIYFSRHGYLQLYNIKDITVIKDKDKFSEFVEWFKERAIQEFGKSDY